MATLMGLGPARVLEAMTGMWELVNRTRGVRVQNERFE